MAISSIFERFIIASQEEAEKFAEALEKASQNPPRKSTTSVKPLLQDKNAIREFLEVQQKNE